MCQSLTETNYLICMDCECSDSWRWQAEPSEVLVMLAHQKTALLFISLKWQCFCWEMVEELCVSFGSSLFWEICAAVAESAVCFAFLQSGITSLPSWGSVGITLWQDMLLLELSWEVFPDTSCVLCPKNQKHTKLSSLCMCPYKYVIVFDEFDYGVGESVCCTLRNFLQARAA